jgi:hypothetical protein
LVAAWFAATCDVGWWDWAAGLVERVVAGLEGCDLVPSWFQSNVLRGTLVRNILHSRLPALEEPPEPSANVLYQVPRVEGVHEGFGAKGAALVRSFRVEVHAWGGFGGDYFRAPDVVDAPGEGPEVEDAEDGHLNAKEEGGDADFYVGSLDFGGGLEDA